LLLFEIVIGNGSVALTLYTAIPRVQ